MEPLVLGVFLILREDEMGKLRRAREMGFSTAQVLCYPNGLFTGPARREFKQTLQDTGIALTTLFCGGWPEESYADIPSVQRTVGIVPRETRAARMEFVRRSADFAAELGTPRIGFHTGFVPEDPKEPLYAEIVQALEEVCDYCRGLHLELCLETGQESAACLRRLIGDVERENLKVNFDPANIILYNSGRPSEFLDLVGEYVVNTHCKDGLRPTEKGRLGVEVPLGQGEAEVVALIEKLWALGYRGPLTIEREIGGEQQWIDFAAAKSLLEALRARLLHPAS